MSKRKFIKPLLFGCACAVPLGLIVGLSVNWDHRQFISSIGSSGVKPFIEGLSKEFSKDNPKIDVQVESGGTTFAIEQLAKGLTNIGNASNNPYYTVQNGFLDKWTTKKTITLGFEGVVIMYKMPQGLSKEAKEAFDIIISENNILDLYAVFSGYAENKNGKWDEETAKVNASMYHYMSQKAIDACTEADLTICQNTQIIPFVRAGGNQGANSSIAFTYYSKLADFTAMSDTQQKAFESGNYGTYCKHFETEESNARAWEAFNREGGPGSMTYLTTGFVKNKSNQEAIEKYGYQLAGYVPSGLSEDKAVYIDKNNGIEQICTTNGYNWFRPINCMVDINDSLAKNFFTWVFSDKNNDLYKKIVNDNGAKELTKDQKDTMYVAGELFSENTTDIKLSESRIEYKTTYGAEELC